MASTVHIQNGQLRRRSKFVVAEIKADYLAASALHRHVQLRDELTACPKHHQLLLWLRLLNKF